MKRFKIPEKYSVDSILNYCIDHIGERLSTKHGNSGVSAITGKGWKIEIDCYVDDDEYGNFLTVTSDDGMILCTLKFQ